MVFKTETRRIPKDIYTDIVRWLPIPTVDIVILTPDKKKTLVGFRTNRPAKHTWYTIGGRLQKHGSIRDRAIRALREETGLIVKPSLLTFAGVLDEEFPDSAWGKMSTHCLNVYFVLEISQRTVKPNSEHSKLDWLPVNSKKIHRLARTKITNAIAAL